METFVRRVFLLILLVSLGACGKQAPKKVTRTEFKHFIFVFPTTEEFDEQNYDLAEEN